MTTQAPASWRPRLGQAIGWVLFHAAYRPKAVDAQLVPRDGAVIFVANHTGLVDGPLAFTLAPRPASFLVKEETFRGFVGAVLRLVGQIPINRDMGDRAALATAIAVLKAGGAVGIFPEGTRGRGDVASVHQGASWLALQTSTPIVPVALLGVRREGQGVSELPRLCSRVVAVFGAPITLDADPSIPRRDRVRAATEQLRQVLAAHVATSEDRFRMPLATDDPRDPLCPRRRRQRAADRATGES